jgi:Ca2+-binding EF-hand superfamily protein
LVLISVAATAAALLCAAVAADAAAGNDAWNRSAFEALDSNHDGRIDRVEFSRNKIAAIFRNAKTDQDSSYDEVVIKANETRLSKRVFDELDRNHTGALDAHDIAAAPMFQFEWWDTNRDGVIDWAEFNQHMEELQR